MSDDVPTTQHVSDGRRGPSLREALRLARIEAAERSDVVIDLRQAEIARLEALQEALAPVFAALPPEVDLFDVGLVPGERPRLFVDMVAFVEMGRDRKAYRFMRDGRNGRVVAAESDRVEPIVEAVTAYVARRLVERERLLADDDRLAELGYGAQTQPASAETSASESAPEASETPPAAAVPPPPPKPRGRFWLRALSVLAAFAAGGALGAAVVVALIVAAAKGYLPGVG